LDNSFQGISRLPQMPKSVTHVLGKSVTYVPGRTISGIALLRAILTLGDAGTPVDNRRIGWMVAIHLTFVVPGVLLALMDWITSKTAEHVAPQRANVQIG
jgi:hypothetical protein